MPGRASEGIGRPNIVLILADDLGINDLGCYGRTEHLTPRIDQLAKEGVLFRSAYCAQPLCSPSRACILTGRAPARLHLTTYLPGRPDSPSQMLLQPTIRQGLPLEEITLAEHLQAAGYATACIGKWHLGDGDFLPTRQGFDTYWEGSANTVPSDSEGGKGEYGLTRKAVEFIQEHAGKPFFLYLCHNSPHIPLAAKPDLIDKYADTFNPTYAAMMESLDDSTGQLLDALDEAGLERDTLVLFSSDNGGLHVPEGAATASTRNDPYRGGKGTLYEGGLRIPMILRWPGKLTAKTINEAPVSQLDWFPTLLDLAGIAIPEVAEGISLVKPLLNNEDVASRTLLWHFPHYSNQGGRPSGAIREGTWKLIEDYEQGTCELYDLARDPSEGADLATTEPSRVAELRGKLEAWRRDIGVQVNTANPDFQPELDSESRGIVFCDARMARVHGTKMQFESLAHKDTLGCWSELSDYASWDIDLPHAGRFDLDVLYGCGTGSSGAEVEISVGSEKRSFQVQETGHFQRFVLQTVGTIELPNAGKYEIVIRAKSKPGAAVMDLRRVTLRSVPIRRGASPAINAGFLAPDMNVEDWKQRFESESREIFTARLEVLKNLGLEPKMHIADIGAGTGLYTMLFSETIPEGWVYAVDVSPRFTEHLRERANDAKRTNISCVLSSPNSIDLPSSCLDRAFICDTYHHFENPPAMLASIRSALKSGGILTVIDFERIPGTSRAWTLDHVRAGKESFCREIATSGFEFIGEVKIPGFVENYLVQFRRP